MSTAAKSNLTPLPVQTQPENSGTSPTASQKHPRGLYVLFGTEMWERFSYYGMRALLVLYLIDHHGWQPSEASSVYKWYTSLVYLAPLLGGFIADRYLGLRLSIVIGAILMGIGQFFLTTESLSFFYTGIGLLVVGNGFFKPNITTLVGRMYLPGDGRRDGAFTIFYMGINLGGLIAPIVCGQWLRANYGYHAGFGACGVGMIFSLLIFVLFRKQVERDVLAAGNSLEVGAKIVKKDEPVTSRAAKDQEDEAKPAATGLAPTLGRAFIIITGLLFAVVIPVLFIYRFMQGEVPVTGIIMPIAVAGIAVWMTFSLLSIKGASRDKSIVIFVLFVFMLLFWMSFEQAGNALNLWAAYHTVRKVVFFDMEAEAYQSINGISIVLFAPLFAWLWLRLNRIGREPSTPMKMGVSMVFMALSSLAMVGATATENTGESRVALGAVPSNIDLSKFNAGRLTYDQAKHELVTQGVLASFVVNDLLKQSADPKYVSSVESFVAESAKATADKPVSAKLEGVPADYQPAAALAENGATWDAATGTLSVKKPIDPPSRVALLSEGAPAEWRKPVRELSKSSDAARVTGFWLFLSYVLATFGELCISPVGLSMVTKLAPTRFASLFMGVWLLSNSVAQYIGGSIGESWGKVTPTNYFMIFVASSAVGAVLLFFLVRPVQKLMHEVR
ncbi:peptide MFS transporter [Pendulispora rubella]|uniref:Peptide MFS transporter n=1 Tax=Pendulispora rubella TaxID=2741070 RepID=A0ABZ2LE82_9BACT